MYSAVTRPDCILFFPHFERRLHLRDFFGSGDAIFAAEIAPFSESLGRHFSTNTFQTSDKLIS
jgi:hypothetical protein